MIIYKSDDGSFPMMQVQGNALAALTLEPAFTTLASGVSVSPQELPGKGESTHARLALEAKFAHQMHDCSKAERMTEHPDNPLPVLCLVCLGSDGLIAAVSYDFVSNADDPSLRSRSPNT